MSQKYTEVEWTDETSTEPGTLINKARLDQMQSAHHYADGFEEVDAVPSADPGVDYHKVVYCTADSTFYRWDGAQWTKDIDDETKALLLAHEADHSNPHVVTKAQVGLGDVVDKGMDDAPTDSSDNYVKSGGVKTALDGKLNVVTTTSGTYFYAQNPGGQTRYFGTSNAQTGMQTVAMRDNDGRLSIADPVGANNAANKKYVDACATDGSVTKVGTADVGSDLKPIKLVAGVPTAVTNDLVDTASAQTISAVKTYTHSPVVPAPTNDTDAANKKYVDDGDAAKVDKLATTGSFAYTHTNATQGETALVDGTTSNTIPIRDANGRMQAADPASGATDKTLVTANWISQTGNSAPNNVVHRSGNETISAVKTFTGTLASDFQIRKSDTIISGWGTNWYRMYSGTVNLSGSYRAYNTALLFSQERRPSMSNESAFILASIMNDSPQAAYINAISFGGSVTSRYAITCEINGNILTWTIWYKGRGAGQNGCLMQMFVENASNNPEAFWSPCNDSTGYVMDSNGYTDSNNVYHTFAVYEATA